MSNVDQRIDLTEFVDRPVVCAKGARLGQIEEVVVNVPDGRIEYVTLKIRTERFSNRPTVTIPWSQFRLADDRETLQLNVSLPVLEAVASRSS